MYRYEKLFFIIFWTYKTSGSSEKTVWKKQMKNITQTVYGEVNRSVTKKANIIIWDY